MKRVFISHGGAGWDAVQPVAEHLTNLGVGILGWNTSGQEQWFVGSALQQLEAASVTVVIVGSTDANGDVLAEEIAHSIRRDKGIVAIRLDRGVSIPHELFDAGAEILDWDRRDDIEYLPQAISAAERSARVLAAAVLRGTGAGATCARRVP